MKRHMLSKQRLTMLCDQIRALAEGPELLSFPECVARLNVNFYTAKRAIKGARINFAKIIPPRDPEKFTKERDIRALAEKGESSGAIAKKLGLTRNVVIGIAYRAVPRIPFTSTANVSPERLQAEAARRQARAERVAQLAAAAALKAAQAAAKAAVPLPEPVETPPLPLIPPVPLPALARPAGYRLMDLPDRGCRYIVCEEPEYRYCGAAARHNGSWCDKHSCGVFGQGTPSEQKAVPKRLLSRA